MVAKKAKDGGVYFATAKTIGLTKIGCSNSITVRLESLRAFCPDDDIEVFVIADPDCRSLESTLHNVFKHLRQHGEWFALAGSDIARVKAKYGELVKELGGVRTRGTSEHFKRLAATHNLPVFAGDKWIIRREIALAHWGQVSESVVGDLSLHRDGEPTRPETVAAVHAWIDCYGYGNLPKGYFAFISDCQKQGLTFYQAMSQKFPDDYDSGTERIPDWGYVTVDELFYEARNAAGDLAGQALGVV
jgi:hypothetical protein